MSEINENTEEKIVEQPSKELLGGLLNDETGETSSKRVLGFICVLVICLIAVVDCFTTESTSPPEYVFQTLAALAFGLLGLTTVDKFSTKE